MTERNGNSFELVKFGLDEGLAYGTKNVLYYFDVTVIKANVYIFC